MDQPASLQILLDTLTARTNIHICVHDISGILQNENLSLPFENQTHTKSFCNAAKMTAAGYRACLRCKMRANQKAVCTKQTFAGYCLYGLYEIAVPVVINGETQCIIYIGNLLFDRETAQKRLYHTCNLTGVSPEHLLSCLKDTETINSLSLCHQMGEIIKSYIHLLYSINPKTKNSKAYHWAVQMLIQYVQANYCDPITLHQAAALYYVNEKYIGRLFKKQTGQSFHAFLNETRLAHAEDQLIFSVKSIMEIALDCGFQNVTYFNRQFMRKFGKTPGEFRKKNTNNH